MGDCSKQVDTVLKLWAKYENDVIVYQNVMDKYSQEHQKWKDLSGMHPERARTWRELYNELRDEKKIWKNCVPWDDASGSNRIHHDWCVNDFGWGHEQREEGGGYGCSLGFGRGACYRVSSRIMDDLNVIHGYKKHEPKMPSVYKPEPPVITIGCCANLSQIDSSKITQSVIRQTCQVNQNGVGSGSGSDSSDSSSNIALIGGIAAIILSSSSSAMLLIFSLVNL